MIKVRNLDIYGIDSAFRGMRNPMNSWGKSDSIPGFLGEEDRKLCLDLIKAGPEHRKFLRMIYATMDVTAPLYWWKEFETYKIGTVSNSCSTMHKIADKKFVLDDFSCEHLLGRINDGLIAENTPFDCLRHTVAMLNDCRDAYLETKDKNYWWQMIQLLPTSYNQLRTISLNYEVLRTIYHQRKNHKLDEWRKFCGFIVDQVPYPEFIMVK